MTASTAARALLGLVLVAWPDTVLDALDESDPPPLTRRAARALGVRHLLEAVALTVRPSPTRRFVASFDLLHGASMVGLAFGSRRYRRIAVLAASAAAVLGLSSVVPGQETP